MARSDRGVPRPPRPPRGARGGHAARGRHPAGALRLALRADRRRGVAQGRGEQPDRLVQGPRHDRGHLGRQARGRRGRGLRVDRQHVRVDGGLRRQGRPQAARADPRGQDRRRQDGPGGRPRRPDHHGPRQLRPLPRHRARAGEGLPRRAGQLGQPGAPPGPEDGVVRDLRLPRRRPRLPPAARRQRRQHRGLLDGLPAVRRTRPLLQAARDARLPGRGCGAAGDRRAVPRPGDQGHRDPRRQPRVVAPRRDGGQGVRGSLRGRLGRADPGRAGRAGPARRRLRRARVGGRHRRSAQPSSRPATATPARRSRSPSPATGSRTPPPRSSPTPTSSTPSSMPTSPPRPLPPVSPDPWRPSSPARCGSRVPATSANLGPGFDSLGLALSLRDIARGRGHRRWPAHRGHRCRCRRRAARRVPPRRPLDAGSVRGDGRRAGRARRCAATT